MAIRCRSIAASCAFWWFAFALGAFCPSPLAAQPPPPNIIVVLVEDQAWAGTSVAMDPAIAGSRSDFFQTPTLEQLAREGLRFTSAYASGPVCSPTRSALQTGKSPAQLQITDLRHASRTGTTYFQTQYNGFPLSPPLPHGGFNSATGETTIAEVLKQVEPSYRTGFFGKYDMWPYPPLEGYDEAGEHFPSYAPEEDPKEIFSLMGRANAFMEDQVQAGNPFFVFVAPGAVKVQPAARAATIEKYRGLPPGERHNDVAYAAMTEDLDSGMQELLDKVDDLGIRDSTYVIYTADHGAAIGVAGHERINEPLFGGKGTLFEGGLRVPFIVRGPGIAPGSVSDAPISMVDLLPTIADVAGNTGPLPAGVEGASLVGIFENGGALPEGVDGLRRAYGEHGEIYFHFPHYSAKLPIGRQSPASAIRDGDFKLIRVYGENGAPDTLLLFNLAENIAESNDPASPLNLAPAMPEKVDQLLTKLNRWLDAVDASLPYDVRKNIELAWDAGSPGPNGGEWRSTIDVDYKDRETWYFRAEEGPSRAWADPYQPGLPGQAFRFDGQTGMTRKYFHVSDAKDTTIDNDHSATFEFWLRFDSLDDEQLLFETGSAQRGLSLTTGDADGDGIADELRLRASDADGDFVVATAKIDRFADPTRDAVQLAAVLNDRETDRYAELYVNGALAARVDGIASVDWDGFDRAGLGAPAPTGEDSVGGSGGEGDPAFQGGNFAGEMNLFRFWNYALGEDAVRANYNAMLDPVDRGVATVSGNARVPTERPSDVREGAMEDSDVIEVIQERVDLLEEDLPVDVLAVPGSTVGGDGEPADGELVGIQGRIDAGTAIASYLLHFDPTGDPSADRTSTGSVTFEQAILGIQVQPSSLAETDTLLGSIGIYGSDARTRDFLASDYLAISEDGRTLSLSMTAAAGEIADIRVLTEAAFLLLGDMDVDGDVDFDDIDAFVLALTNPAGYESKFHAPPSRHGDTDQDGDLDYDDIGSFAQRLHAQSATQLRAVPEPPTGWLLLAASNTLLLPHGRPSARKRQMGRRRPGFSWSPGGMDRPIRKCGDCGEGGALPYDQA